MNPLATLTQVFNSILFSINMFKARKINNSLPVRIHTVIGCVDQSSLNFATSSTSNHQSSIEVARLISMVLEPRWLQHIYDI